MTDPQIGRKYHRFAKWTTPFFGDWLDIHLPVIFMSSIGSQVFVPQPNMIIYCIQTTCWSCSPRICWNCLNCLVLETRVTLPEKFAQTLVCLKQRIYFSWQNNGWIWMCFGLPTSESTRNDLKNYCGQFFFLAVYQLALHHSGSFELPAVG